MSEKHPELERHQSWGCRALYTPSNLCIARCSSFLKSVASWLIPVDSFPKVEQWWWWRWRWQTETLLVASHRVSPCFFSCSSFPYCLSHIALELTAHMCPQRPHCVHHHGLYLIQAWRCQGNHCQRNQQLNDLPEGSKKGPVPMSGERSSCKSRKAVRLKRELSVALNMEDRAGQNHTMVTHSLLALST